MYKEGESIYSISFRVLIRTPPQQFINCSQMMTAGLELALLVQSPQPKRAGKREKGGKNVQATLGGEKKTKCLAHCSSRHLFFSQPKNRGAGDIQKKRKVFFFSFRLILSAVRSRATINSATAESR